MKLTEPKYSKSQVLEMAGITSAQFNNWMARGLVPRNDLGFKLVKLTKAKYSVLIAAYCQLLAYHTGQDRKLYIQTLTESFKQLAAGDAVSQNMVIAISEQGTGKDCAVFDSTQHANQACSEPYALVPVGQIISTYINLFNNDPTH